MNPALKIRRRPQVRIPIFCGKRFVCVQGKRYFGLPFSIGDKLGLTLSKPRSFRHEVFAPDLMHPREILVWCRPLYIDWYGFSFSGPCVSLFKEGVLEAWSVENRSNAKKYVRSL